MSAKANTVERQTEAETIEYGDQFKHVITGDVRTVHDVREGSRKVLWAEGGFDYKNDLLDALDEDTAALYEPHNRGDYWK
jgi:hypothetical protein